MGLLIHSWATSRERILFLEEAQFSVFLFTLPQCSQLLLRFGLGKYYLYFVFLLTFFVGLAGFNIIDPKNGNPLLQMQQSLKAVYLITDID